MSTKAPARPWTPEEVERLLRCRRSEVPWELIAVELGHSPHSCKAKCRDEKLKRNLARPFAGERRDRAILFRTLYRLGLSDREGNLLMGGQRFNFRRRELGLKRNSGITGGSDRE